MRCGAPFSKAVFLRLTSRARSTGPQPRLNIITLNRPVARSNMDGTQNELVPIPPQPGAGQLGSTPGVRDRRRLCCDVGLAGWDTWGAGDWSCCSIAGAAGPRGLTWCPWAGGWAGTSRPISALVALTDCGVWVKSFKPLTKEGKSPTLGVFHPI